MKNWFVKIFLDAEFSLPMKYINLFCYYVLPALIFGTLSFIAVSSGNSPELYHYGRELGEKAWFVLLLILFIKPLTQIFSDIRIFSKILVIRRQLGVLMMWLYLGHAGATIFTLGYTEVVDIITVSGLKSFLFWGMLAGWVTLILGLTSNTAAVKLLKKNWKRLHMLSYPLLVFVALHIYFIKQDISPFLIILLYGVCKLLAWKKIKIPVKKYFFQA